MISGMVFDNQWSSGLCACGDDCSNRKFLAKILK